MAPAALTAPALFDGEGTIVAPVYVPEDHWAAELVAHDKANLNYLVTVHEPQVDWSRTYKDWLVVFVIQLVNASVFALTPKLPIHGRLHCSSGGVNVTCSNQLELAQTSGYLSPILHGQRREIRLEQRLDGSDVGVVWGGNGPREFNFGVDFMMESTAPDGSKGPDVRVPLPAGWSVPHPNEVS